MKKLDRRKFLKATSASALSLASLSTVTSTLTSFSASAQENDDYKALVCVFLFGGLDNHEVVLPYDEENWQAYAAIRESLLSPQGANRERENLLPLFPLNQSTFGAREFALPPELSRIKKLFDEGNAAIIGNVGPLIRPTDRKSFEENSVLLPPRLFSHNDQQSVWQANAPEGAQFGWGGLFADAAIAQNPAQSVDFSTISSSSDALFLTGTLARPYQISTDGAASIQLLKRFENSEDTFDQRLYQQLRAHFSGEINETSHLITQDVINLMQNSLAANEKYNRSKNESEPLTTSFPASPLGQQLRVIAESISMRNNLNVNRQVFFVGIGNFDTHSDQASNLPKLLEQVDESIDAFYRSMQSLGLGSDVTLFTASDFGRTLTVNGDGTDHGWGGHHFVVGDAVIGQQILGDIPPPAFEHDKDAGNGRLIPSVSIEQFASPLGRWFGLSEEEIANTFPNLENFQTNELRFI
ncbi:DUF1501 domain-containing protein [Agaribacter marinus]|uniref:Tat pathway signal protein n=1 Tax=Agaribacter marinus TaxID=1431249 RepID=A0AA37T0A0_9ALTE|nr:DUF1501 domain-containing protein [Agaribacter marinus]GLR69370.1 Tat pathway signal protein [Agaribacter marinus]